MSDVAIRVNNLSKEFRIGKSRGKFRYKSLRDSLSGAMVAPFRRVAGIVRGNAYATSDMEESFWALRDVSFEVKQGEAVGVIGRNGAGKSTLLKILSEITEPSEGSVELHGRVGSLLEVGTGFHPELTGRDNIYLNGAILGMKRAEIHRKFDEIVDFAEVEKFIDTPVKHYSSGMYVRLAFAVAAHLEPEILVVDEVLAVGDAAFQKKCLGKMGDVAKGGRTVIFVSHQMNAVRSLCHKGILLSQGRVADHGDVERIINEYQQVDVARSEWASDGPSRVANKYFSPTRMAVVDKQLNPVSQYIRADEEVGVVIEGIVENLDTSLTVGFAVYAVSGELLFWSLHTDTQAEKWPKIKKGYNKLLCWIPSHFLNEGDYRLELMVSLHFIAWMVQPGVNAPAIQISVRGGLSESPHWMIARPGYLAPVLPFTELEN